MSTTFPIVPSGSRTMVFVAAVVAVVVLPVLFVAALNRIAPLLLAVPIVFIVAGVVIYAGASSRRVVFEVSPEGLRIRRSMFGRFIPRDKLSLEGARPVDMRQESELRPVLRLFGAGLIGYIEGWFLLRSRQRALAFVTDRSRVAMLATRSGAKVLLSVEDPALFLATAAQAWGL
jgi:hypothetical protein